MAWVGTGGTVVSGGALFLFEPESSMLSTSVPGHVAWAAPFVDPARGQATFAFKSDPSAVLER